MTFTITPLLFSMLIFSFGLIAILSLIAVLVEDHEMLDVFLKVGMIVCPPALCLVAYLEQAYLYAPWFGPVSVACTVMGALAGYFIGHRVGRKF